MDAAFKSYEAIPGMDIQRQVPFDVQDFVTQATQGAIIREQEGWVQHLHQDNIQAMVTDY